MKKIGKQKGITLIALVIVIIVLLILAGISIATLTGNNGIFIQGDKAKKDTIIGKEKDEIAVAYNGAKAEKLGKVVTADNLNVQFGHNKTEAEAEQEDKIKVTFSTTRHIYYIVDGKIIGPQNETQEETIVANEKNTNPKDALPEDSKVIQGKVQDGLVIKDKNNNEWVWIEVPKTEVFKNAKNEKDYQNIEKDLHEYAKDYRKDITNSGNTKVFGDEWYAFMYSNRRPIINTNTTTEEQRQLRTGCGLTYDEYKEKYQKMLKSIYEYGGFWIGRYEAGDEESSMSDVNRLCWLNERNKTNDDGQWEASTSGKAVLQPNQVPYDCLTTSSAQKLASKMAPTADKTTSLMFGIQWDLVCKFLEGKDGLKQADLNEDSKSWGNYNV